MQLELVVCPGCRTVSPGRIDVRTLDRVGDLLVCECGRRYPIIDGVPIVLSHLDSYLRAEHATLVERDLAPEVSELLATSGPDDAPYARLQQHLATYLDAHWGHVAMPPLPGDSALRDTLRGLDRVGLAVELGCSVGGFVRELAATADHVVGLDIHAGALRRARRILAGERVAYGRRSVGRYTTPVTIERPAVPNVTLVCGDALDPPLVHGQYDRVVAFNLLDNVSEPAHLLAVLDGLCAPGGEILVASPYQWRPDVTADSERIGGADPAGELVQRFRTGHELRAPYEVVDEAELTWTLRSDDRAEFRYRTHYLRLRKA